MKCPEFLEMGGTIAFAAPSFGAATEPYRSCMKNAVSRFFNMGYQSDLGPNTFLDEGIGISNTPEKCAAELEDYYCSHGDVLISVSGGELMGETIEKLDFNHIASAKPKWFLGYSDNTHFGFLLPTIFDTASLYGPNATSFGKEPVHESLMDCMELLTGKNRISHGYDYWEAEGFDSSNDPLVAYNLTEKTRLLFFNWDGEPLQGRFLGGCLDVLNNLCGTRFDKVCAFNEKYKEDGIIWFMEACDLSPMDIRRSLWHLKNAGWFDTAKAFVFGRPYRYSTEPDAFGVDHYNAAEAVLGELNLPIIFDADIGHLPPSMTMVNGGYGILSKYGEVNIQIKWML